MYPSTGWSDRIVLAHAIDPKHICPNAQFWFTSHGRMGMYETVIDIDIYNVSGGVQGTWRRVFEQCIPRRETSAL
jgi:hypothetical protein